MKAVRVHECGGPEVLLYEDAPDVSAGSGQVVVSIEAIGVNFIDIYHRSGLYPIPTPFTPGSEAAGTIRSLGEGVTDLRIGDRVAYAMERGSYAEAQAVSAWRCVPLPESMDTAAGAAIMLQGMTAHYLCYSTFPVREGHRILVHAAAGGVGLLLIQMAKRLGARVYGTVSTAEKAQLARASGADEVILYTEQDVAGEIRRLTDGEGVDVVYDSVGQATFQKSLECLHRRGYLVSFGQSSGPIAPFNPAVLAAKGSLFLTRPTLVDYAATREETLRRARDLFSWHAAGDLQLHIGATFPLSQAAEAHRRLEGRQTTGTVLLRP
jgi:NADPH2:quinone reductase